MRRPAYTTRLRGFENATGLFVGRPDRGADACRRGAGRRFARLQPVHSADFVRKLFRCHGPDSASRKADLRLDRREAAIESGAIVPGKPAESELVGEFTSTDADQVMPPAITAQDAHRRSKRNCSSAGSRPAPNTSRTGRSSRPPARRCRKCKTKPGRATRSTISFWLGWKRPGCNRRPRPIAARLRDRVSLDLTGLPPAPEQVERSSPTRRPTPTSGYVDRLLASPQWGEHRGRYWLDAARYADTHGIHFDNYREMWSYRDWVIGAFNRNLPFDQFTIEQLAGDLLPNRTLDQLVASGFNRCNMTTNEGGVIPEEYLVLYTRDRTETTSQVWLGMTTGCAVCHDHKFDPLTQREFYELAAFFNNTTQGAMDGNVKDTPPIVVVPNDVDRQPWDQLPAEITEAGKLVEARRAAARGDFDAWLASARSRRSKRSSSRPARSFTRRWPKVRATC